MSLVHIRTALETALAAMSPSLSTAWENVSFTPPSASTPYQRAVLIPSTPDNPEIGRGYEQGGILHVSLYYPLKAGSAAAMARAELLRSTFYRGASFTSSGVTVQVRRTPDIGQGLVDGDRWFVPVKIRFASYLSS